MATASLFEECQSFLEKGHESWKSYFSKWEVLAEQEKDIEESDVIDELNESLIFANEKKKKLSHGKPLNLISSLTSKKKVKKKNARHVKEKKTILRKDNKKLKTQELFAISSENIPEDSDNEKLEMDLRTVFKDILKANKNKWEIFGVLSQTFSLGEITIKSSHSLLLNQHLALRSNDVEEGGRSLSFGNNQVFSSAAPQISLIDGTVFKKITSFNLKSSPENSRRKFPNTFTNLTQVVDKAEWLRPASLMNEIENERLHFDRFQFRNDFSGQPSSRLSLYGTETPRQTSRIEFNVRNTFSRSCPSKIFSQLYSNDLHLRRNKKLKPLALDFGSKYTTGEGSDKINNDRFGRNSCLVESLSDAPEMNVRREKSFQNLCLHKRTNGVSLNMENSNFITPERKPSERKCFSENILPRKKRRPSKLSFFDYEEDDSEDEDDEQTENRSPIIRWQCKKRKTETNSKAITEESDSDDCEVILERVARS